MTMKRVAAALLASAALSLAGDASATTPPSPWDVVRDPQVRSRYELHLAVSKLMDSYSRARKASQLADFSDVFLLQARAMLEDGAAATSPDAQLRFDLGRIYQLFAERDGGHDMDMFRRAAEVLDSAITLAPSHPASEDALLQLATCYARTDTAKEVQTYDRLLAVAENPRTRAIAYLNRSEALMRLGHLDLAIEDARYAAQIDAREDETALANMDLAVELDRYGDGYGAMRAAEAAVRGFPRVVTMLTDEGSDRSVFFVPDYDKYWYRAVAFTVLARACGQGACIDSGDPSADVKASRYWGLATNEWAQYLARAEVTTPWLSVARKRQAEAKKKQAEADAKVAKLPKGRTDPLFE